MKNFLGALFLFLSLGVFSLPHAQIHSALAPRSLVKQQSLAPFFMPHAGVNLYIERELPEDLDGKFYNIFKYPKVADYDVDAHVIPIDGLFTHTGQVYHIGLGHVYADAIIYVDEAFAKNPQVLKHALYVISHWEGLQMELKIPPYFMRIWIQQHLELAQRLEKTWREEASQRHDLSDMIDRLRNAVDPSQVAGFAVPFAKEPPDLLIGAGMQHLEASL